MTPTLVVLWVAATAAVAWITSLVVGSGLAAQRRRIDELMPAAQTRVLFAAAAAPLFVATLVMTAALAPNFGWIVDHCLDLSSHAAHPHICIDHHGTAVPSLSLLILAGLMITRLGATLVGLVRNAWTSNGASEGLRRSRLNRTRLNVLPLPEPRAFVAGLWRPVVYVTEGLLNQPHRPHLRAVLAHEAAHARNADPLRKFVLKLLLAFHLPGISHWIERSYGRGLEVRADERAARSVGPVRVAEALVHLARFSGIRPVGAVSFVRSDLEYRVHRLLRPKPLRSANPDWTLIALAAASLTVATAFGADGIHHGVEHLLGVLST